MIDSVSDDGSESGFDFKCGLKKIQLWNTGTLFLHILSDRKFWYREIGNESCYKNIKKKFNDYKKFDIVISRVKKLLRTLFMAKVSNSVPVQLKGIFCLLRSWQGEIHHVSRQ